MAESVVILHAPECATGLQVAAEHPNLDVVFVELTMPGMSGELAVREFGKRRPELPVIVLSSSENPSDVPNHRLRASIAHLIEAGDKAVA